MLRRRKDSMIPFKWSPSTNSMTMKYASSPPTSVGDLPMSKTPTMLACCNCSDSRASSRNMEMNFLFLQRLGRMRFIATDRLKPCKLSATPRNTSAMPPASILSMMRYFWCSPMNRTQRPSAYPNRNDCRSKRPGARRSSRLFAAGLVAAEVRLASAGAGATDLGLRLLFALALFLAVDAQGGDRSRQQALDADRLAAVFALVDGVGVQPIERRQDLAEQVLLAVAQAELRREQLLLHRLVDRIAADRALAVHREGEPLLRVAQEALLLHRQRGAQLIAIFFAQHDREFMEPRSEMSSLLFSRGRAADAVSAPPPRR